MQADSFGREENVQKHARSPIRRLARAAAILALAVAPHLAAADSWTDANGCIWSYSVDNGDATITGVSPAEGDITIPASIGNNRVTCIGNSAFEDCSGLTSVTIPDGVTSIGDGAFSFCSGLTSVTIPDSVTSLGAGAFGGCTNLTSVAVDPQNEAYKFADGFLLTKDDKGLVAAGINCKGTVTIPGSVMRIGDGAFSFCSDLTGVTIPDSVTHIGNDAFRSCSGLTSVTIPDSVTSIGDGAFGYCSDLTSIKIPAGVTSIGARAFAQCGLESVTIPADVTSFGFYAFYECSGLTRVTILDGVTHIESYAFASCSSLTSVTIPASVTVIKSYAFARCSSLTSVTIPASVTDLYSGVFDGCSGLTCVTFDGDAPTVDMGGAFNGVSAACVVRLPRNNATYKVTDGTWQGMTVEWHDGPAQPTFSVGGKGTIAESGDGRYVVTANEGVALAESDFAFPVARKAYRVEIASGGATAVVALKAPFEVERSGAVADGPWTEDGEGSVTLNVEIVPGLYYAAASAASLDGLVCPGASAPATAATRLVVRKPVGSPSGFFKVWVSERPLAAGGK